MRHARMLTVERGNKKPVPRPLSERGRIMYAEDIQILYGKKPNGRWRRSIAWVHRNFAPEYRNKDGREVYWWETDVAIWMDSHKENAA